MKTRTDALTLLRSYISNENLIKHCMAVEAAMKYYAALSGEDGEKWGITGLLHDLDYEKFPEISQHSLKSGEILEQDGYDPEIVHAVKAHNRYHNIPLETLLDKTLLAVDELTGLITAAALVRPSKSVSDLEPKSILKRMKEKAFAKNVNREEIILGAELIGKPLEEHIGNVIKAMRGVAKDLGL
jgi:putative nucleotidyltransferase with HDIG domain